MKKLGLTLFSCIALVAFMGMSGSAWAVKDKDCDGAPYDNTPLVHDFVIDTPNSHAAHAVSNVEGVGLACGSELTFSGGDTTLNNHADIRVPGGVDIANSAGHEGEFVGSADVRILYRPLGPAPSIPGKTDTPVHSVVEVGNLTDCQNESATLTTPHSGHPTGTIVACYYGSNALGWNWNWVTKVSSWSPFDVTPLPDSRNQPRYALTVGPMHDPIAGVEPGLTYINMRLCGYFGSQTGTEYPADCGTSGGQFIQKNGDASVPKIPGSRNGKYKVTVTRRDGLTTPSVTSYVPWTSPGPDPQ